MRRQFQQWRRSQLKVLGRWYDAALRDKEQIQGSRQQVVDVIKSIETSSMETHSNCGTYSLICCHDCCGPHVKGRKARKNG